MAKYVEPYRTRKPKGEKVLKSGTISLPAGAIPSPSGGKSSAFDFSQALLQGHPAALAAASKVLGDSNDEASLADRFVASLYDLPKRMMMDAHHVKLTEPIISSYRQDMRRAHRFVLDNDFTRYATEVSSTSSPEKLLARLGLANLPYDVTWIEFDLKTKVETMRRFHNMDDTNFDWNEVAQRLGLLIRRLSDTRSVVEMICETFGDHGLIGTTICYFFSTDEYEWSKDDGKGTGCRPFMLTQASEPILKEFKVSATDVRNLGSAAMWGYSGDGKTGMIESIDAMKRLALPGYLMRHGVSGTGRMREIIEAARARSANEMVVYETIAKLMVNEITEFAGMMRWLVIVLAMLNEVPIRSELVKPSHTMRAGLTRRVSAFDYHRLTLRLPKTKPVPWIERQLSNVERHHKAHEVRAHWRTYLPDVPCELLNHTWEYDQEHGYALCGKCMAFRRRIREHVRGDPSLGWVRKDYVVKRGEQD